MAALALWTIFAAAAAMGIRQAGQRDQGQSSNYFFHDKSFVDLYVIAQRCYAYYCLSQTTVCL
jgi:hypothetical protein